MDYPDINPVVSAHVETVVLLSQKKPDDYIDVDLDIDTLNLPTSGAATYKKI